MSEPVDKAKRIVGTAGAIVGIVQLVASASWDPESGRLDKLRVFGIPVFDRARMEARRARRKARRAE